MVERLEQQMHEAADALEFERAARLRDQLTSVRKAVERQQMVSEREEDLDVIGLAEDEIEASVQVFFVRRGRVVGRKGLVVDKVEDVDTGALVGKVVEQLYGDAAADDVPREVLVPVAPRGSRPLRGVPQPWSAGVKVRVRVPQRGDKRELLAMVTHNATGGVHPAQAAPGVRPQRPRPSRSPRCRTRSISRRRRCASSASTSPTSRAPRSSARWW